LGKLAEEPAVMAELVFAEAMDAVDQLLHIKCWSAANEGTV
jgi:hypothetical protein